MKITSGFQKPALLGVVMVGLFIAVPNVRSFIMDLPTVTIEAIDSDASEVGTNTGTFRVTRTGGDLSCDLWVYFEQPVGGTAQSGTDYQPLPEYVGFPGWGIYAEVTVTPILDVNCSEGNETVVLTLATNANYWVGWPSSAANTIADVPVDSDSDGDGMLDCWELEQFDDLDETGGGNPDGDALTNLQEYLHGTNPNQNDTTSDANNAISLHVYTPLK